MGPSTGSFPISSCTVLLTLTLERSYGGYLVLYTVNALCLVSLWVQHDYIPERCTMSFVTSVLVSSSLEFTFLFCSSE